MPRLEGSITDVEELREIIRELEDRFDGEEGLHERMKVRKARYHNESSEDPLLPPPYNETPLKYQSDLIRRTANQLKARLTENHFLVKVDPARDTETQRKKANDLEEVLNKGLALVEERESFGIQSGLADGQAIYGMGVLHWVMADHLWPPVPDPDMLDELPSDAEEARRFRNRRKDGKFQETPESVSDRHRHGKARAGFPWLVETIDPTNFYFLEDRSLSNGLAIALVKREVGLLQYARRLRSEGIVLSVHEVNKQLSVYAEQDAPSDEEPSSSGWKFKGTVYQVWFRDEFYEVVVGFDGASNWEIVKSGPHPYEMPPFAIVPANVNESTSDPALRFEPALEGLFRIKPFHDRQLALMHVISENIALPFYYWKNAGTGEPRLDEEGKMITFTRNSNLMDEAPAGYEVAALPYELNPAFIESVKLMREDFEAAVPPTGRAEFSQSTQPWAIRLQQAQENVEPARLMFNQVLGIQTMCRSMGAAMSKPVEEGGFGEAIYVYTYSSGDKRELVGVEPEDIKSLDISVSVNVSSASEQITKTEHGRQLLADPKVPLTLPEFVEEYMNKSNPDEVIENYRAEQAFELFVLQGLIRQEIAKIFGTRVVVGADGEMVGPDGSPLTPEQVVQMGQNQENQRRGNGAAPSGDGFGGGAAAQNIQPVMPGLDQLATPGTVPLPGIPQ